MNHIYRSLWNHRTRTFVAVSEHAASAGKRSLPGAGVRGYALTLLASALMLAGAPALAGPTGGVVTAGQASIGGTAGALTITQSSQKAALNWDSFSIGAGESVRFVQPNAQSVALNRVVGGDPSRILGSLSANGQVFLVNPNGVLFGAGASVHVGGLVASTLDITANDFMAGHYRFTNTGRAGKVLNQGRISAPGGVVALLGTEVANEGVISARLGSVALAAGQAVTLDLAGDGLLNVAVDQGAVGALVRNGGLIQADGGSVLLTAQAAGELLKTVVNNTGVIEAHSIDTRSGTIKLLGDMGSGTVQVGGTLDASAPNGGSGGFIDTSAAHVQIDTAAKVTTLAAQGLSGTWLIDPADFNIAASGGDMTGAFLGDALASGSVVIQSSSGKSGTQGNINVKDTVSWAANKLTLNAQNDININAALKGTGTASLALQYGQGAVAAGNASTYNVNATVDLPSGQSFSTQLGSNGAVLNYTVLNSLGAAGSTTGTDLQGMNGNLTGYYALGSDIDASATASWNGGAGFSPIGGGWSFQGRLEGLGHSISGLTMRLVYDMWSGNMYGGLFGRISSGGVVRNLDLVSASVTANGMGIESRAYGTLAGMLDGGVVEHVGASGLVVADGQNIAVGGLIGSVWHNSRVSNSDATVAVSGSGGMDFRAGGLAAENFGSITNSYAAGTVGGSGGMSVRAGGLVAENHGSITNSYAAGTVGGSGGMLLRAGGLVAANYGSITNTYAAGTVSGSGGMDVQAGGLVAFNQGSITNGYYNTDTGLSGVAFETGTSSVTGLTRAQMADPAHYPGFNFTTTPGLGGNQWVTIGADGAVNGAGGTLPMLSSEYASAIRSAHQLQLMAMDRGASYTLASDIQAAATGSATDVWGSGGFVPVGSVGSPFSGSLDGAGHVVHGLSIDRAGQVYVGLFGVTDTSASVRNLGLEGGRISGGSGVGALVGYNSGTVSGSFSTASVVGVDSVGGLAGWNAGTISDSYAAGDVSAINFHAGGLVARNSGVLSRNYAAGVVESALGGVFAGGLVAIDFGGTSTDNFWNITTSGQPMSAAGTGLTTAQMLEASRFSAAGWDMQSMWIQYDGHSTPLLRSFMTPLVAQVSASTKVYDGVAVTTDTSALSYSRPVDSTLLFGTPVLSGSTVGALNVGTYSVSASGLYSTSQHGYAISYQSGGVTITPKALTVVGVSAADKVYNGTTNAALSGGSLQGFENGETLTLSGLTGSFADANAGAGKTVTVGGATLGNGTGLASNYTVSNPTGLTASITPKALTVEGVGAADKVYNGDATAALSGGTLAGLVGEETLTLSGLAGAFADQNAGTGKTVTVSGATLGNGTGLASNYTVANPTGVTASITPKALTLTGVSAADKVYDGSAVAALTGASLSGLVGEETLTLSGLAGTFADQNAGTGKAVTVSGAALGNGTGLASNYTVANPTGVTASITPKALTVEGVSAADKVYNGNAIAALSGGTLDGLVSGETLTLTGLAGAFADQNAGTGKTVTVSGATLGNGTGLASNYTVANPTGVTASITPKALTVEGVSAADKVYNGDATAALSGGSLSGLVGEETLTLSGLAGAFADQNAGAGKAVTVSGATLGNGTGLASNYTVGKPTGVTASITPKALTLTGVSAADKVYNGDAIAVLSGGTLDGLVSGETLTLTGLAGAFADQNAGTGKTVTVSGATLGNGTGLASNYTVANPTGVTASITPKALTVGGVSAADKVYDGDAIAALSGASLSGLVGEETLTLSGLAGAFADQNAGAGKAVTVSGATLADGTGLASNYTVGNPTGVTASITPKALTVVGVGAADKVYDGDAIAALSGGSLSGLVGEETLTLSGLAGTFADQNAGTGKAVTVSGAALGNGTGLASNYTVGNPTGVTASITPKALTLTGVSAADKVYNGDATAALSGGSLSGLVGEETLTLSGLAGAFADKNAGVGKAVTVSGATLADGTGLASNYTVGNPTGVTASITPKALTVGGVSAADKVYNGDAIAALSGGTLAGLVGSETLTLSGLAGTFADQNAGAGKAVTVSGATLGNGTGLASNYTVGNPTGVTASITPAALTVRVNDSSKLEGQANPAFTAAYQGFVAGEAADVLSGVLAFGTAATSASPAGSYAVTGSGQHSNNYALRYVDGSLLVSAVQPEAPTEPSAPVQMAVAAALASTGLVASGGGMHEARSPGVLAAMTPGFGGDAPTAGAPTHQTGPSVPTHTIDALNLTVRDFGMALPGDADGRPPAR